MGRFPLAMVTDVGLVRKVMFFSCGVLGLLVREQFYVVHLFQIIFANKGLLDVLRAVTENGKQLMLTLLLLLIVIWAFAVWASEFKDNGAFGDFCLSPGQCWMHIVDSIALGGIGAAPHFELAAPDTHPGAADYLNLYVYHFAFSVVVMIILMNVVFGIIIDTFGELRGEKAAKKAHMDNTCFICGIDRFTFDTKGNGFDEHIRKDHWMWTYLALMIHVLEKPATQHNGWETYIAGKMAEQDTSFLPRNAALVLLQAEESADEAMRIVVGRLDQLERSNERLQKSIDLLLKAGQTRREKGADPSK
jgi:hypothetical protein